MSAEAVIVSRFPLVAGAADLFAPLADEPGAFLLESGGGPAELCAWSFLGHSPCLTFTARGRELALTGPAAALPWATGATAAPAATGATAAPGAPVGSLRRWQGDPFVAVDSLLTTCRSEALPGLPPLCGGLVGYFAYDAGRCIERLPATARADLDLPDVWLGAYDAIAAVDHAGSEVLVLALPLPGREDAALAAAAALAARLRQPPAPAAWAEPVAGAVDSNFTAAAYRAAVARAREYIHAGDVFQVNLAQRFRAPLSGHPWSLYRRLRRASPAPFAAYLHGDGFAILSASPERFLQVQPGGRVETRPIKGTRRRGATPAEDLALRSELAASEKDRAELLMIVDLARNDLGRVCAYGSVRVPELRRLEAHPTVWHTVATVAGRLRPGVTAGQLLRAAFPGGSVTGAPKVRAMEIIEELEGVRRGVYCGALGYLSFDGHADLNIVIRTLVCRGDRVYFHAGGGIVADSDPAAEYEETLVKAAALLQAVLGHPAGVGR